MYYSSVAQKVLLINFARTAQGQVLTLHSQALVVLFLYPYIHLGLRWWLAKRLVCCEPSQPWTCAEFCLLICGIFASMNWVKNLELPERVRGSASTGATRRNEAIGPMISRMILISSTDSFAAGLVTFNLVMYRQHGTSPFVDSGTPNTATSETSGCRSAASSRLLVDIR